MKKTKQLTFVIVLLLISSCQQQPDFQAVIKEIEATTNIQYLAQDADFLPAEELLGEKTMEENLAYYQKQIATLSSFEPQELKDNEQIILKNMQRLLQQKVKIFSDDYKTKPTVFSIVKVLETFAKYPSQTPEEQFVTIMKKLEQIPPYFSKAKTLIENPDKENTQTAMERLSNDYFFLKNELSLLIRKPDILKDDQIDFSEKSRKAEIAVKDFIAFLNSQLFEIRERELLEK